MIHSLALAIAINSEGLTCGGFSLSETVHFGSLEFIADCFSGMSLSPKGSDWGTSFMGSTRSGSLSLWAMIEDSIEELYTASSGEWGSSLPSSLRHGTGALPAPAATTPWLEVILVSEVMMMIPPRSDTGIPLER
jgi:hypothetical protein